MSIVALGWLSAGLRLVLWAFVCWLIATGLDWLNHDPYSAVRRKLDRSPMALAVYRGSRWAAILVGSAIILS